MPVRVVSNYLEAIRDASDVFSSSESLTKHADVFRGRFEVAQN